MESEIVRKWRIGNSRRKKQGCWHGFRMLRTEEDLAIFNFYDTTITIKSIIFPLTGESGLVD